MQLPNPKKHYLIQYRSRLRERGILIDTLTQVAGRPKLTLSTLPTLQNSVTFSLLELQPGRVFTEPVLASAEPEVNNWMTETKCELLAIYDTLPELIEHYQNYLAMSDEQRLASDKQCKLIYNRSNTELFSFLLSDAYNQVQFGKYSIQPGDIFELESLDGKTHNLAYCSSYDATRLELTFAYLQDDDSRIFGETDTFMLQAGDIDNYSATTPIRTTVGRYLLNQLLLVEPFHTKFDYINTQFIDEIGQLESNISKGLIDGSVAVASYKQYINNLYFIGHFTELCVPTYSRKSLSTHPEVSRVKQQLLAKYKDHLDDPAVISEIENQLIKLDKEHLKGDSSMRFYTPLGDKPFNISRKKMYLAVGGVEEFVKGTGKYEFIENSLSEGMTAKSLPAMANETRKGSFNRGDQTKLGGALTKLVTRVLQDLVPVVDDCHTVNGLLVDTSKYSLSRYLWSYIWSKDKWVLLTEQNLAQFNKGIQMIRSPLYCKAEHGLCTKCLGEIYAKLDKRHLALEAVDVTSTFTTDALKSMHGTKIAMFEVKDLQEYLM